MRTTDGKGAVTSPKPLLRSDFRDRLDPAAESEQSGVTPRRKFSKVFSRDNNQPVRGSKAGVIAVVADKTSESVQVDDPGLPKCLAEPLKAEVTEEVLPLANSYALDALCNADAVTACVHISSLAEAEPSILSPSNVVARANHSTEHLRGVEGNSSEADQTCSDGMNSNLQNGSLKIKLEEERDPLASETSVNAEAITGFTGTRSHRQAHPVKSEKPEDLSVENSSLNVPMPPSETVSDMGNDDLEKMLKWKNNIGYLPGSDIRFRKTGSGALEVITLDSDMDDMDDDVAEKKLRKRKSLKSSKRDLKSPVSDDGSVIVSPKCRKSDDSRVTSPDSEKRRRKDRKKKRQDEDEILKCETCGSFGVASEFRASGRFCTQRCVGLYASKCREEKIQKEIDMGIREVKPVRKHSKKRKSDHKRSSRSSSPTSSSLGHLETASTPAVADDTKKTPFHDDATFYYSAIGHAKEFTWDSYLNVTRTKAAPVDAFIKEYPGQEIIPKCVDGFEPKMKLECVDPRHPSLICAVTIMEIQGCRMRLHFDGWSECYDFWINTNSPYIHPCGWCKRSGNVLEPPKDIAKDAFNWESYLRSTGCVAAPEHLFVKPASPTHGFTTGMKLEAVDRLNPDLICVASVNGVVGNEFLIHFDEWDDSYDYWCRADSPYIHPMGWCKQNGVALMPPRDDMIGSFCWEDYLKETNCIAAPEKLFQKRLPTKFKVGYKLEAIDPRNPSLARVASVVEIDGFRLKIHLDGWDSVYDFWTYDDSTDIHPVKWCERTGHPLEVPPSGREDASEERSCPTRGCRGIGHIRGARFTTHHSVFGCPYSPGNLNRSNPPVSDRLAANASLEESAVLSRIYKIKDGQVLEDILPDSTTKGDPGKPKVLGKQLGRPSKKHDASSPSGRAVKPDGSKGFKRKRRPSDEVSSTSISNPVSEHSNSYLTKPVPPIHRPAFESDAMYPGLARAPTVVLPWSTDDVTEFIKSIGFGDLALCFKDNLIDGAALLLLSQADLVRHMKIKLGPALKIYNAISRLELSKELTLLNPNHR